MSKKPNILSVLAGFLSSRTINENFTRIADAFDNTLSRDGSLPNHMNADFDMNSNDILNVKQLTAKDMNLDGRDLKTIADASEKWAKKAKVEADRASGYISYEDSLESLLNSSYEYPNGTIIETRAEGFRFEVVDGGGHKTTAGGVQLYILPEVDGPPFNSVQEANTVYQGTAFDYGRKDWSTLGDPPAGYYSLYGATKYRVPLWKRIQVGPTVDLPTSDPNPVLVVQKTSKVNRDTDPQAWDQGSYFGLLKVDGDAYGASLTGYGYHTGGAGDIIGVHGRGRGTHRLAKTWGMWSYALAENTADRQIDLIGHEINIVNKWLGEIPFSPDGFKQEGEYRGLVVATADGSRRVNTGISINAQSGTGGFNHGLKIRSDTIAGSVEAGGKTGAILIEGRTTSQTNIGRQSGIIFGGSFFEVGIDFRDVVQRFRENRAIVLRPEDRITWEDGETIRAISYHPGPNPTLEVKDMFLSINGSQVLSNRRIGWGADTDFIGPRSRAGFDSTTVTASQLASVVSALIEDLRLHGLIGVN